MAGHYIRCKLSGGFIEKKLVANFSAQFNFPNILIMLLRLNG